MKTDFPIVMKWNEERVPEAKVIYKGSYKALTPTHQLQIMLSLISLLEKERQRIVTKLYGERHD